MPRRPRMDGPGVWHHVGNRGIAKRTFFENIGDIRFFLSRLALTVRAGLIRVHAYSLMATHFHLLLESLVGQLSCAMQRIQNEYVRRFNRQRKRDGPLVRARFWSKRADSERYRRALVPYIDANAAKARIVRNPQDYPYASAHHYARREGPPWLCRSWVESIVCDSEMLSVYDPSAYGRVFTDGKAAAIGALVRQRLRYKGSERDSLDDLVGAAPAEVQEWMTYKASLADQTKPGIPLVDTNTVLSVVRETEEELGSWSVQWGRKSLSGWAIVKAVLLRDLCGQTYSEIARRLGSDLSFWRRIYERHAKAIEIEEVYAERIRLLTQISLEQLYGS